MTSLSSSDFTLTLVRARDASAREAWEQAVSLWNTVTAANPVNGDYWQELATALDETGDHRAALDAWQQVFRLGQVFPSHTAVCIARCHARLGDTDTALTWLRRGIDLGYHDINVLADDEAFASLRNDPAFRALAGIVDPEPSRDRRWEVDLDFAAREIKRRAFSPFATLPEAEFDAVVDRIRDQIPTSTDAQLMLDLWRLLRRLNDGHARVMAPDDRPDLQQALPLQVFCFPEGVHITAISPEHGDLAGARLVRIGDHDIETVIEAFEPIITRDNENEMWFLRCLQDWLPYVTALHALGLAPHPDRADLTVETVTGETKTVTIAADPDWPISRLRRQDAPPTGWTSFPETLDTPLPLYLRHPDLPFWFQHLPEERTVYFQFNSVRDMASETMESFGHRVFATIDATGADRLVIDMRWNGGGNTLREWPLLHQIAAHPRINRRGALFVITGRGTFSAAQNGVNFLATHTEATFVGEPTGSSPQFIGETNYFSLPYSKLVMNVSDLHWVGTWPGDHRPWIAPDLYAPPTFTSYRENQDPALAAILSLTETLPGV